MAGGPGRKAAGKRAWPALLACLCLLAGPSAIPAADRGGQDSLTTLPPENGAVPGWTRDGESQEFAGEDLYVYIDGGAEIYQEYGFRRVVIQDYKDASGRSVSLEIFEMAGPEAAFGIYTFKRSGKGTAVALGAGGDLEDYYLNFWKGRLLVTLTGFDDTAATLAGLQALAKAVDARIPDAAAGPPALVSALPPAGLRPGSVKYLKGLLGLNNVYSFTTARGLAFGAAVKGDYENGTAMIVLDYGTDEARAAAWNELKAFLDGTDRFRAAAGAAGATAVYRDGKNRYVAFAPAGARLLIGLGDSAAAALGLVR